MNEFKTREECLRYYVDKYNKERDWEPEVDFDKLLPMLDNPPTVTFDEILVVIRFKHDKYFRLQPKKVVEEDARKVMEYSLINLCLMQSEAVHWSVWPTEEEYMVYLNKVWVKRDICIYKKSHLYILLRWLVFSKTELYGHRVMKRLAQLMLDEIMGRKSSSPKLKRDLIETTIDSLVEKISSFFSTPAAAETFLRRNEDERKRNGHSDRVLTQVIEHYISTHQIVDAPSSLHELLYRAGYWKTGYSNWNKNFNPTRFKELRKRGAN